MVQHFFFLFKADLDARFNFFVHTTQSLRLQKPYERIETKMKPVQDRDYNSQNNFIHFPFPLLHSIQRCILIN